MSDSVYMFAAVALLTLCCILTRAGYFLFGDRLPLTDRVRRALRYAPVAALTAIVVPDLLPWSEGARAVFDVKMLAAISAVLIYWRTRSTLGLIAGGMCAYWLIDALRQWVL